MIEAAGAFDAWGSAVVSGGVAGLVGVIGIAITLRVTENTRRKASREEAASRLSVQVSNLRDAATQSRRSWAGDYDIYPLRNEVAASRGAMASKQALKEVEDFLLHVTQLRGWFRDNKMQAGATQYPQHVAAALQRQLDAVSERADWITVNVLSKVEGKEFVGRPPIPSVDEIPKVPN